MREVSSGKTYSSECINKLGSGAGYLVSRRKQIFCSPNFIGIRDGVLVRAFLSDLSQFRVK